MGDEIIDHHSGNEVEIAGGERAADHIVAESAMSAISKVPEFIRDGNVKAYEPQILAIGPYHRGKNHLRAMEEHKSYLLQQLLTRKCEKSTYSYVLALKKLEKEARACYVDSVNLDSDEFVEMMLLDACFIVELVRGSCNLAAPSWIMTSLMRDLLLVENQLPFFVLQEFYEKTKDSDDKGLCDMICKFFASKVPYPICPKTRGLDSLYSNDSKHLLGLLHISWINYREEPETDSAKPRAFDSGINFIHKLLHLPRKKTVDNLPVVQEPLLTTMNRNVAAHDWEFIRCATELEEAGITFKMIKSSNLFHVKFENGVMEIPRLEIDDGMESFFRNFIAYEQFHQQQFVIDYVILMNCLINTSKDVQLLCQRGIIMNGLGDDKVLARMFNRLGNNVTFCCAKFMYNEIFEKVNQHCNKRWNRWMASLRHNYFNNPWALISFLAALLLLLLAMVQTVFAVLAYIN